jgi:dihydroneopterin aldolase
MDKIIIEDLEVAYRVGVPAKERAKPQRLLVTVEMKHDFDKAAKSDRIEKTINYHAVVLRLEKFGTKRSWKLIETLAVDIAGMILEEFGPEQVSVEIKKFILPQTRHVAVKITRPK